jgi:hypothetical protein
VNGISPYSRQVSNRFEINGIKWKFKNKKTGGSKLHPVCFDAEISRN